jgi:hypothetical protein
MTEEPIDGALGGAEVPPEPQPVSPDPEPFPTADEMDDRPHRPAAGWLLIVLGALLLLGNLFHISGGIFLIALGGAFLAGYFTNRRYGLLVPAMLLIGLGVGVIIDESRTFDLHGFEILLFLGLGFISIYLVDRFSWNQSTTWPLWPGGILVIIALWGIAVETGLFRDIWWEMMDLLGTWWPVLLIIWGVFLLRRRGGGTGTGSETG